MLNYAGLGDLLTFLFWRNEVRWTWGLGVGERKTLGLGDRGTGGPRDWGEWETGRLGEGEFW